MAKKPKEKWQIEVRNRLDRDGIGYKELAEEITKSTDEEVSEHTINKAMCTNKYPGVKKKICNYLGIKEAI